MKLRLYFYPLTMTLLPETEQELRQYLHKNGYISAVDVPDSAIASVLKRIPDPTGLCNGLGLFDNDAICDSISVYEIAHIAPQQPLEASCTQ